LTNQIIMFSTQAILIAILILVLFKLRKYLGLSPLYVTLGVFQPIQVLLASSIYVEIIPGVIISPGSVIMFSASLYAILLVYIRNDAIEARKVIYGIMIANLAMTFLLYIFGIQLGFSSTLNFLNLPLGIFNQGARVMLSGTFTLFVDVLLIIFVFEWIGRIIKYTFLRIYVTMSIILTIDTLLFATGAFLGQPNYTSIITAGIFGKVCIAAFYSIFLTFYLRFWVSDDHSKTETTKPLRDIFYALTYREKYEIEKQRLVVVQESTSKAIKESEERYRTLYEDSPVSLWEEDFTEVRAYIDNLRTKDIVNFREYFSNNPEEVKKCLNFVKIINVNQATLKLHKAKSKEELLGNLNNIFTEISLETFREELILIADGGSYFESEGQVKTLSNDIVEVDLKFTIISKDDDRNNNCVAMLAISDITERIKAEETMKEKTKELQQSYNMMIGREIKMVELKNEINELLKKEGKKAKY
jgi:PAS domain-containing protein